MAGEVGKISKESSDQEKKHVTRTKAIGKLKEKIVDLKGWNEHEHSVYLSEYEKLQVSNIKYILVKFFQAKYKEDKEKKKIETKEKNQKQRERVENLETQAILKRRLQRIILVTRIFIEYK